MYKYTKATLVTWRYNRSFLFCSMDQYDLNRKGARSAKLHGFPFSCYVFKELPLTRAGYSET